MLRLYLLRMYKSRQHFLHQKEFFFFEKEKKQTSAKKDIVTNVKFQSMF